MMKRVGCRPAAGFAGRTPGYARRRSAPWQGCSIRSKLAIVVALVVVLSGNREVQACDLCALHGSSVLEPPRRGFSAQVTEQFTSFNTYKNAGDRDIPVNEWMQSSITNVILGYGFTAPWRIEVTIPFIDREYRRWKDEALDRSSESGLGDVAFTARFTALDRVLTDTSLVRIEMFAGIELPTGDADFLREEEDADPPDSEANVTALSPARPRHGGNSEMTGIHDQDLALGSGSVDLLLGVNTFATYRRMFATAGFQYGVRGRGAHDYRYDNDLSFYAGLGKYLLLHSHLNLGVEARLAGETKGNDEQDGETVTGSNLTALYVGPHVHATYDEHLRAAIGVQIPMLQHVQEMMIVADYRILANLGWQF
jgi:hypothetical protein